jgi:hypothetical protein
MPCCPPARYADASTRPSPRRKVFERHHIFPRAYLRSRLNVTDNREINQIANMALVEWADNIAISDDPPALYWPAQKAAKNLAPEMLARQQYWHALPDAWEQLDYPAFLAARRKLMGQVVRDAYAKLHESGYRPVYPEAGKTTDGSGPDTARSWTHHGVHLADLISADLLLAGTTLLPAQSGTEEVATVLPDGKIAFAGEIYSTPSAASGAASGVSTNGWTFWTADTPEGRFTLAALREEFLARQQ